MHLLKSYALCTGALIGSCHIEEDLIDLPQGPYLTLHAHNAKGTTRSYSHWHPVVEGLRAHPVSAALTIVQVGGSSNPVTPGADDRWLGRTTYNTLAFLVARAALHLGFDSFPRHLASHFDRPLVCVFAQPKEISGPFFSSPDRAIILEPPYGSYKPAWSHDDSLRLIDRIPPDDVVTAVVQLLKKWAVNV